MINSNEYQKRIILYRYCEILNKISEELNDVQFIIYHFMKILIPLLRYIIPSLYTILHFLEKTPRLILFWVLWALMIIHSIMSGFIEIFNLDKKYSLNLFLVEKLEIEMWEFLTQISDYEINDNELQEYSDQNIPSHQIAFQKFVEVIGKIAKIKMQSDVHYSRNTKYIKNINTTNNGPKRISKLYNHNSSNISNGNNNDFLLNNKNINTLRNYN